MPRAGLGQEQKRKEKSLAQRTRSVPTTQRRPFRWRRFLFGTAAILLLFPPALLALYRVVPPLGTPLMLIRAVQGEGLDYRFVPLGEIAPALGRSVIASEDNLFCRHWGIDVEALRDEIERAIGGARPRGASTITQQAVKNLLLWPGRDLVRKAIEAWLAPQADLILGKRRLLELYLNVVEWAPGVYGAEAAARHHFAEPAADLTRNEAARLAVVLPNPLGWSPRGDYAAKRARTILRRVGQLGPLLDCAP